MIKKLPRQGVNRPLCPGGAMGRVTVILAHVRCCYAGARPGFVLSSREASMGPWCDAIRVETGCGVLCVEIAMSPS